MLFEQWWHNIGSGIAPLPEEDQEEHARRVSQAAWNAAVSEARGEALKSAKRPHKDKPDAVGARNCIEISAAISELHSI